MSVSCAPFLAGVGVVVVIVERSCCMDVSRRDLLQVIVI